jgi:sorbitol-specific phosphotransferase system component IIBC
VQSIYIPVWQSCPLFPFTLHSLLHVPQADLVQSIAELVESKVLQGVNDVRDESDRSGTRVVVEVGDSWRCMITDYIHAPPCTVLPVCGCAALGRYVTPPPW